VRIDDKRVTLGRDEVIQKMRGVTPSPIRQHSVVIEGVKHPIKKAFSHVTGSDVLDFNTSTARNAFKKLGFQLDRI
jgi:hypothetical protein